MEESAMQCTGERYMPEFDGDWTLEHTHRYLLACELAADKVVLDIACGDGYGSRMLADVAKQVIGVDISFETVEHAVEKYPHARLSFMQGSVTAIPLADASVDIVTSFETLEHLSEHEEMLQEIRRVLRPEGLLLISSPDKHEYSEVPGYTNEYHVRELYRDEFVDLLKHSFLNVRMLGQRIVFGSLVGAEDDGTFLSWRKNEPESRTTGLIDAEYWIALAGDVPLPALPSSLVKHPLEQSDRVASLAKHVKASDGHIENLEAWKKETSGYVTWLEDWKQESSGYITWLEEWKKSSEDQVHALETYQHELVADKKALEAECAALEADRRCLREKIVMLETQSAAIEARRAAFEQELSEMYASRSWKMTAPFRSAAHQARRMLRRKAPPVVSFSPSAWPPDVRVLEQPLQLMESTTSTSFYGSIGAFVHIYYTDLAREITDCLHRLPDTAFFHISTDTEEKQEIIRTHFTAEGLEKRTEIRVCPNQGWDIAPFLVGYADALRNYSLILRLHSKRSIQISGDVGENWRKMLFTSLAGSVERVNAVMHAFETNSQLGMLCPPIVDHYADCVHFGGNFSLMQNILQPHGILLQPDTPIDFPMGSMFWCRPEVLFPWLDKNFSYNDFVSMAEDERDSSLAHAMERLFFFGCGIAGYSWARVQAPPSL